MRVPKFLQTRNALIALGIVIAGGVFVAGALTSFVILEFDRIQGRLQAQFSSPPPRPDSLQTDWSTIETSLLTIERNEVSLGNVDGSATGGAIAALGDHLIYASANGHLANLNVETGGLDYSNVRVPMDYDRVRRDVFSDKIQFNQNWYRVHDLLVEPAENGSATLYVSHHQFDPSTELMCNVINKRTIRAEGDELSFGDGDWTEIYRLDDCIHLPDDDWRFNGHMSGGRMLRYDETSLLVSVGEFGLANFLDQPDRVSADSGNHLAKIIRLDEESGEIQIFATGVRNPQGLLLAADGRIWETEHAAQGGDEINLLIEGENYGWPNVALGTEYGAPRKPFPRTPRQGSHDGYVMPAYAFVPSVGVANLEIIPPGGAFDLWAGDLMVTSLVGETLYRLRPYEDRIVYSEPIPLGARLRDIVHLDNGWLAILTGNRSVIFLREPAAESQPAETVLTVSGYDAVGALEAGARAGVGEYSWGRDLYRGACATCHRVDGQVEVAPPLNGIIGRRVGDYEGFPYSQALNTARGRWSKGKLDTFIQNPQADFPGAAMSAVGLDKYERRALIDYLAGLE